MTPLSKEKLSKKFDYSKINADIKGGLVGSQIMKKYGMSRKSFDFSKKCGLIFEVVQKYRPSDEEREIIRQKRIKYLKDNPDSHVWKRSDKFKSVPCERVKEILRSKGVDFLEEFQPLLEVNRFFTLDIAFPQCKIGIEINGNQHYNSDKTLKSYYQNRHDILVENGWKIYELHYSFVYKDSISSIIDGIIHGNNITEIDIDQFSTIRKKTKRKTRKQRGKSRSILYEESQKPKTQLILYSDIDFSKFGWVTKVSHLLEIHPQRVNRWMKRFMLDFYNEKCFKRVRA